ncbi:MAG TPA: DUF6231 family protein [Gammaproteobacteria bacterium]|nr:DUF6231 family protein [Gammaproteobacteria bacterium]
MSVPAQACVASLLETCAPASLLVIGAPPMPPKTDAEVTCVAVADAAAELAKLGRFDYAIVSELVERLDVPTAETVLGRLKNLHTDRFVLLADPARSCLGRDALLALALAPSERLDDGRIAWCYDIDRYNPERDWNNPEDWAHPKNFDRFRW